MLRAELVSGPRTRAGVTFGGAPPRAKVGRGIERWIEVNVTVEARQDDAETGSWRTHTLRYDYSLYDTAAEGHYLLAYHFHPDPEGVGHQRPHVHVRSRPAWAPRALERTHLPTGRVACEAFVGMLIEEFQIRHARPDWERILAKRQEMFESRRTWE